MRSTFELNFYNSFWEGRPGGEHKVLEKCSVTRVQTKRRFYWPKLRMRLAHRCVVTYIDTEIGEFWVWDRE